MNIQIKNWNNDTNNGPFILLRHWIFWIFWIFFIIVLPISRCLFALEKTDQATLFEVDEYLIDPYAHLLSPSTALGLIHSDQLRILYEQGKQGNKNKASSLSKLKSLEVLKIKPMVKLVQALFHMVERDPTLRISNRPEFFQNQMTDSNIGLIIRSLLIEKIDFENKNQRDALPSRIAAKIHAEFFPPIQIQQLKEKLRTQLRNGMEKLKNLRQPYSIHFDNLQKTLDSAITFEDLRKVFSLADSILKADLEKKDKYTSAYREIHKEKGLLKKLREAQAVKSACDPDLRPTKFLEVTREIEKLSSALNLISLKFLENEQNSKRQEYQILSDLMDTWKEEGEPFFARHLVKVIVDAAQACRNTDLLKRANDCPQGEEFVYRTLIAHALLKSKDYRKSLFDIWKHMPEIIRPIFTQEVQLGTLKFQPNSQILEKLVSDDHSIISKVTGNPRPDVYLPLVKFQFDKLEHNRPPLFNQNLNNTDFEIANGSQKISSADCCEATFLNFFTHFKSNDYPLNHQIGELLDSVKSDKSESSNWINPKDPLIRTRIKEVFSNQPNVEYLQKVEIQNQTWKYDLAPSVENFMSLVENWSIGLNVDSDMNMDSNERLNRIAKAYGIEIQADPYFAPKSGPPWTEVKLTFIRDGEPLLKFELQKDHCMAFRPQTTTSESDTKFFNKLTNQMIDDLSIKAGNDTEKEKQLDLLADLLASKKDQTLSADEKAWDLENLLEKMPELKRKNLPVLLSRFDIDSVEDVGNLARFIFEHKLESQYHLAIWALSRMPFENHSFEKLIFISRIVLLNSNNYPPIISSDLKILLVSALEAYQARHSSSGFAPQWRMEDLDILHDLAPLLNVDPAIHQFIKNAVLDENQRFAREATKELIQRTPSDPSLLMAVVHLIKGTQWYSSFNLRDETFNAYAFQELLTPLWLNPKLSDDSAAKLFLSLLETLLPLQGGYRSLTDEENYLKMLQHLLEMRKIKLPAQANSILSMRSKKIWDSAVTPDESLKKTEQHLKRTLQIQLPEIRREVLWLAQSSTDPEIKAHALEELAYLLPDNNNSIGDLFNRKILRPVDENDKDGLILRAKTAKALALHDPVRLIQIVTDPIQLLDDLPAQISPENFFKTAKSIFSSSRFFVLRMYLSNDYAFPEDQIKKIAHAAILKIDSTKEGALLDFFKKFLKDIVAQHPFLNRDPNIQKAINQGATQTYWKTVPDSIIKTIDHASKELNSNENSHNESVLDTIRPFLGKILLAEDLAIKTLVHESKTRKSLQRETSNWVNKLVDNLMVANPNHPDLIHYLLTERMEELSSKDHNLIYWKKYRDLEVLLEQPSLSQETIQKIAKHIVDHFTQNSDTHERMLEAFFLSILLEKHLKVLPPAILRTLKELSFTDPNSQIRKILIKGLDNY